MVQGLDDLNLRDTLLGKIRSGTPFLGICVGLQYLFSNRAKSRRRVLAGWAFFKEK